ncbi:C13 family peptidase [Nannocystis bainbridge]|uniref:C13 family peptidase n=1 Tax=Nannocystis bainbridge TaxID=2995303 RepID=A0ABT5E3S9_9BACT|nr:C13 family peptidase [Nannocystis bainbridge]MDC0720524.1 C13 family peptidase [Nannocystis bainbridge]
MSLLRALPAIGLALALTGCGAPLAYSRFVAETPYSTAPLPARAHVFLIAGGSDVANFAAEVAAQRELLRTRGVQADEIACYWAQPTREAFRRDRAQYRRLAAALVDCYPAATAIVREHLARAAASEPPFLYVYVSTHGLSSLLPPDVPKDLLEAPDAAMLDQYALQLAAGPGRGFHPAFLMAARRAGAPTDDLVFSPGMLARALQALPAATPKVVVLQACHAGGFAPALAQVPGLVGLAAARHDRTSFGCDPGPDMTIFGAIYIRLLERRLGEPAALPSLDWHALYKQLQAEVTRAEAAQGATPSLPVLLESAAPEP